MTVMLTGSSVALSYLYDSDLALWCTDQGLALNPKSHAFKNNKIVALARGGDANKAKLLLDQVKQWKTDELQAPFYHAACGLIAFRKKEVGVGREHYEDAIRAAKSVKNSGLMLLAIAYLLEEESVAGSMPASLIEETITAIDDFMTRVDDKRSDSRRQWRSAKKRIEDRLASGRIQSNFEFDNAYRVCNTLRNALPK